MMRDMETKTRLQIIKIGGKARRPCSSIVCQDRPKRAKQFGRAFFAERRSPRFFFEVAGIATKKKKHNLRGIGIKLRWPNLLPKSFQL